MLLAFHGFKLKITALPTLTDNPGPVMCFRIWSPRGFLYYLKILVDLLIQTLFCSPLSLIEEKNILVQKTFNGNIIQFSQFLHVLNGVVISTVFFNAFRIRWCWRTCGG